MEVLWHTYGQYVDMKTHRHTLHQQGGLRTRMLI